VKIQLWAIGKNHEYYVIEGVNDFTGRIANYYPVQWIIIAPPKDAGLLRESDLKKKEAALILKNLKREDCLIVLDSRGKSLSSEDLALFIQARASERSRNLVFLIGGAYGVDDQLLKRAQYTWSLSSLTFPHQLVRLILAEQLYRACTITRNEKYHHG
jgi:23S rRNA (pseudouridine1915-N3)-methyltransferase